MLCGHEISSRDSLPRPSGMALVDIDLGIGPITGSRKDRVMSVAEWRPITSSRKGYVTSYVE